jgi:hypothetical protein
MPLGTVTSGKRSASWRAGFNSIEHSSVKSNGSKVTYLRRFSPGVDLREGETDRLMVAIFDWTAGTREGKSVEQQVGGNFWRADQGVEFR